MKIALTVVASSLAHWGLNRTELFVERKQPIHFSWYKKAIMSDHLLFRRKKNRQQFLFFSPPDKGKQHLHWSKRNGLKYQQKSKFTKSILNLLFHVSQPCAVWAFFILCCKSITCTISLPISKHKQITRLYYIHQLTLNWYRHAASIFSTPKHWRFLPNGSPQIIRVRNSSKGIQFCLINKKNLLGNNIDKVLNRFFFNIEALIFVC